jgi:hypothetical protein
VSDFEALFEIDEDVYFQVSNVFRVIVFGMPICEIPLDEISPQLSRVAEAAQLILQERNDGRRT